ncbi:type II toxin-antitoxin system PemK/MazF family toxin [Leptospira sp. 'Mane']|uniref:type II toxin-antitoxin system PemK/MazF family toxin n=1 Tax=Leptospira sp. 'Mane' TaxID=3387407 RepID=UPI00398ADF11
MIQAGSICMGSLPQADGKEKDRPVLVLSKLPGYGDWLVCGISSKTYHYVDDFDELLENADPDFTQTGLKRSGLVRLGFISYLPEKRILGIIGSLPKIRYQKVIKRFIDHLSCEL